MPPPASKKGFLRPQKKLSDYLEQYDAEHQSFANRVLHMLAIPLAWMSLPLLFISPLAAACFLFGGMALQSTGHTLLEPAKRRPIAPARRRRYDPFYTLAGVVWVGHVFEQMIGAAFDDF